MNVFYFYTIVFFNTLCAVVFLDHGATLPERYGILGRAGPVGTAWAVCLRLDHQVCENYKNQRHKD